LDSANGPSATERPFFCETILPSGKRGLPAVALPSAVKRSNHPYICFTTSCISSGERPLCQSVPRNNNIYSEFVVLLMIILLMISRLTFALLSQRTNARRRTSSHFLFLLREHTKDIPGGIFEPRDQWPPAAKDPLLVGFEVTLIALKAHAFFRELVHCFFNI